MGSTWMDQSLEQGIRDFTKSLARALVLEIRCYLSKLKNHMGTSCIFASSLEDFIHQAIKVDH